MKIIIAVATHKQAWMPEDPVYLPLRVGAAGKEDFGYQRDDAGNNISAKNPGFCELTGLYWAWKNTWSDALGLVHYRRMFARRGVGDKRSRVLMGTAIERLLARCDILVPSPRHYWIETNESQYAHAHHAEDLRVTREILMERCPEYIGAYERVMRRTWGHKFNMFIMKREKADAYCAWLFPILFELERRLQTADYSMYDARVFGFVSERLLDIWIEQNGYAYLDVPYVFLDKQNWLKKGAAFLRRKFIGKEK